MNIIILKKVSKGTDVGWDIKVAFSRQGVPTGYLKMVFSTGCYGLRTQLSGNPYLTNISTFYRIEPVPTSNKFYTRHHVDFAFINTDS